MANLLRTSGRIVNTTLSASAGVISNASQLVDTGESEVISVQLSSLRNDMKEEREATNSEEVVAIREAAAKQRAKNKALAQYIAAELERRELEREKRQLELEKKQLELDRRKLSYKL